MGEEGTGGCEEGYCVITDDQVDSALDWLIKHADKAAEARAHRVLLEEATKSVKAKLMKDSGQESLGAQEREALASDAYQTHLEGLRAAVYEDERYRLLRAAAEARLEIWRSQQANQRIQGKVV